MGLFCDLKTWHDSDGKYDYYRIHTWPIHQNSIETLKLNKNAESKEPQTCIIDMQMIENR
jgi:hypothetical protein